jgi:hypothetical protein
MKSVKISDQSYAFIKKVAISNMRSFTKTIDLLIDAYREALKNGELEDESLRPGGKGAGKDC